MSVLPALRSLLIGDPGVSAKVGTRVRPLFVRENDTLPAIAYQQVSTASVADGSANVRRAVVQFRCVASDAEGAEELADAVESALRGKSVGSATAPILYVSLFSRMQDYDVTAMAFSTIVGGVVYFVE